MRIYTGTAGDDRARRARATSVVGFGERPVDAYFLVDLVSRLDVGPGSLEVGVRNLLNRQYFRVASQLLRTGRNDSYAAARGTTLSVGYTVSY